MQPKASLDDTLALMRDLRARCPWDAAQTHESLRPYLIEETHELDDALRAGDDAAVREELGDVLLQVLFHSVVAEERGAFDIGDVAAGLIAKMRARHPHLYGDGERRSWEELKAKQRASIVDGLPTGLPALHRAQRLQDRAAGVGFDWPDAEGPLAKVAEELEEVRTAMRRLTALDGGAPAAGEPTPAPAAEATASAPDETARAAARDALEAELGDLLFACVNLCRKLDVHAGLALDRANAKFARRFTAVERLARERGREAQAMTLEELDALWEEVKGGEG